MLSSLMEMMKEKIVMTANDAKAYFSHKWVKYDERRKTLRYHRSCHDDVLEGCRSFIIDVKFNYDRRPCTGCGAEDHRLLGLPKTRSRLAMRTYCCPVVTHLPYKQNSHTQIDYYVCPKKLVEHYRYEGIRIGKAVNEYLEFGVGQLMTPDHKQAFREEIRRLCQEEGTNHQYRRVTVDDEGDSNKNC